MNQLGKERANKHAELLYYSDFDSLVLPSSKVQVLAAALVEAEAEIAVLQNKLRKVPDAGDLGVTDTSGTPLTLGPTETPGREVEIYQKAARSYIPPNDLY